MSLVQFALQSLFARGGLGGIVPVGLNWLQTVFRVVSGSMFHCRSTIVNSLSFLKTHADTANDDAISIDRRPSQTFDYPSSPPGEQINHGDGFSSIESTSVF